MLTNPDPDRNIEELNDDEIYAAIRYLALAPRSVSKQSDDSATTKEYDDNGVVICVCNRTVRYEPPSNPILKSCEKPAFISSTARRPLTD
jgi:hypothetical protein